MNRSKGLIANDPFSFAGTIYLYKVVSGKQKYVDCYPTNGSGIAFTGISGQIDTHVRKGTYVVRWVGAAAGPIWIAVLRPDVQIGFSL